MIAVVGDDDHDDGCLLAVVSQRGQQPPLLVRLAHSQVLPAPVELVKLQLHRSLPGPQYGSGANGSFRTAGKCAGKPRRINDIRLELVFRGADEKCSHKPNEISCLGPELVFRDVPGKLVQWSGYSQWFRRGFGHRALLDPVGDGVVRIPTPPTRLSFLPAGDPTFGLAASIVDGRQLAGPEGTTGGRSCTVSSEPLAWCSL